MVISNWYKNMLDNFINSSDDNIDNELWAILKQIDISNNDFAGFEYSISGLKRQKHMLKNGSHRYYQRHNNLSFSLDAKKYDGKV